MQGVWIRRCVAWVSVLVGVCCLAIAIHDKAVGQHMPVLIILGLTYGLIFAIFLPMDAFGRQVAKIAREKDTMTPRPRPTVSLDTRRALALADDSDVNSVGSANGAGSPTLASSTSAIPQSSGSGELTLPTVQLHRVRAEDATTLQSLLDDAARELSLLAGTEPHFSEDGHAVDYDVKRWLADGNTASFIITLSGEPIGCCVIEENPPVYSIQMLYVDHVMRRRGFATEAFARVRDYVRLTGRCEALRINLPKGNARARSFFHSLGFHGEGSNADEWILKV